MAWCEEKKKKENVIKSVAKILYFQKISCKSKIGEKFQICYMKNGL